MPFSTALHISYSVKAATEAAVNASISTPVPAVVCAVVSMRAPARRNLNRHIKMGKSQGMAKWNEFRRFLPRLDSCNARDLERIAFRQGLAAQQPDGRGGHLDERLRPRNSQSVLLRGNIHHARLALFIDMSQSTFTRCHTYSIGRNCAVSPGCRTPSRRGIKIRAFAFERPGRSEDPFHGAVSNSIASTFKADACRNQRDTLGIAIRRLFDNRFERRRVNVRSP